VKGGLDMKLLTREKARVDRIACIHQDNHGNMAKQFAVHDALYADCHSGLPWT
jgi:hypothetical protein